MLSTSQTDTLTLRASAVHAHAVFPYFEHNINRLATETIAFPKKSSTPGEEPRMMKMPSHLNFYVRYKPLAHHGGEGEKSCRWSRVVRVRRLADVHREKKCDDGATDARASAAVDQPVNTHTNDDARARLRPAPLNLGKESATAPTNAAPVVSAETIEWRGKIFWVCLEVEGEAEPVTLPQLSNKPPTSEEVEAYCRRHALEHPSLTYMDTPLTDDAVLTREVDGADLRVYLPTNHQIAFLDSYWKKEFAGHAWTDAELEDAKELNRRYLPRYAGAAAGPVSATLSHLGNLKLATNLGLASSQPYQRSNMRGSHAALRDAHTSSRRTAPNGTTLGTNNGSQSQGFMHLNSASSPLLWTQASASSAFTDTQHESQLSRDPFIESGDGGEQSSGHGTQVLAPQTETLSQQLQQQQQSARMHAAAVDTASFPRSPFLPRKRLRAYSQHGVSGSSQLPLSAASSTPATFSSPTLVVPPGEGAAGSQSHHGEAGPAAPSGHRYTVSSMELLGGSQSNHANETPGASLVPSSLTPPQPPQSLSQAELRAWEEARQSEGMFYQYVTNTDRSRFINMLADITQRNMEENRRTRLIGIENEKKRVRRVGFEDGGLATVRAGAAPSSTAADEDEKKNKENTERGAEADALVGEEDEQEKAFVLFDKKASRELSFESVPDDFYALGEEGSAGESGEGDMTTENAARTRQRQRRAGTNPNMLILGEAEKEDHARVCSQLVHRSAWHMARSSSKS